MKKGRVRIVRQVMPHFYEDGQVWVRFDSKWRNAYMRHMEADGKIVDWGGNTTAPVRVGESWFRRFPSSVCPKQVVAEFIP